MDKNKQRIKLRKLGNDKRYTFTAEFGRVGYKTDFRGPRTVYSPTIMLKNLKCNDELVTDHLWLNYTKGFAELGKLKDKMKIQFNARVKDYTKKAGLDYKLERPTKVTLLDTSQKLDPLPIPSTDDKYYKNCLIGYIMKENKDFYLENNRPYEEWYVDQFNKWEQQNN